MRASRPNLAFAAMIAGLVLGASGAQAHPHVWVIMNETVLYDKGSITGLQQAWTFDEFYTQQAIEGLDKNGDGKYDREELKDLAQVNIDGLKEFAYFTFAKLGDTELKFKPPVDYWLDYSDKKHPHAALHAAARAAGLRRGVRLQLRGVRFRATSSPSTSPRPIPSSSAPTRPPAASRRSTSRPRTPTRKSSTMRSPVP